VSAVRGQLSDTGGIVECAALLSFFFHDGTFHPP
jgi:hypothetical protein